MGTQTVTTQEPVTQQQNTYIKQVLPKTMWLYLNLSTISTSKSNTSFLQLSSGSYYSTYSSLYHTPIIAQETVLEQSWIRGDPLIFRRGILIPTVTTTEHLSSVAFCHHLARWVYYWNLTYMSHIVMHATWKMQAHTKWHCRKGTVRLDKRWSLVIVIKIIL